MHRAGPRTRSLLPRFLLVILVVAVVAPSGTSAAERRARVEARAPAASRPTFRKPSVTARGWIRAGVDPTVPGEIVVGYTHDAVGRERAAAADPLEPQSVRRLTPSVSLVRAASARSDRGLDRALRILEADPAVAFAEPNLVRALDLEPDDPRYGELWGLSNTGQDHPLADPPPPEAGGTADADIDANDAWDSQTGASDVIVAVVDSGVDVSHPDLDGSLWVNAAEDIGTPGVDDDGNGYVDDVNGYDFADGDADPSPGTGESAGHGTHVAGTIAAEQNNTIGVTGVCPGCRIMALRFGLTTASEVQAVQYAIDNGADIINASFGAPVWSRAERAAVADAGAAGILFVASAGNAFGDNDMFLADRSRVYSPSFPATYTLTNVLAVAASNHRDEYGYDTGCATRNPKWQCQFTNFGEESVDLAAPGVDVVSTWPVADGPYAVANGTSMAAPHVAGVAGLVRSSNPSFSPEDVKNAIMNSVDAPAGLDRIYVRGGTISGSFTRTAGRANALSALSGSTVDASPVTDGAIQGAVGIRRSKRGRVGWPEDGNDVYRKRLRRGHGYRVSVDFGRNDDLDVWIWEPGTEEIWKLSPGCYRRHGACPIAAVSASDERPEVVTLRARETGVYFIQVESFLSRGRYVLRIGRAR